MASLIWRKSCVAGMRVDDLCLCAIKAMPYHDTIPIKINYIYIKV